nr:hypothetical protein [uncultured Stomatobaculum sp.]
MPLNEPKTGDSVRETPRIYVRQEDRYEDLQSSASAFMIVCIVMSLLSLFSFGSSLHLPFSIPATPMMRFFFIFFAIGSFVIYIKTRREAAKTYARIEEEQRITEELEAWFLSSYTPGQIDLQIFGANRRPLRPEALALKRFDFIQDCFLKRYEGMDEGYIEALSEELYKKLFESGMNPVNTATPEEATDNAETLPDASAHAACATTAAPAESGDAAGFSEPDSVYREEIGEKSEAELRAAEKAEANATQNAESDVRPEGEAEGNEAVSEMPERAADTTPTPEADAGRETAAEANAGIAAEASSEGNAEAGSEAEAAAESETKTDAPETSVNA